MVCVFGYSLCLVALDMNMNILCQLHIINRNDYFAKKNEIIELCLKI